MFLQNLKLWDNLKSVTIFLDVIYLHFSYMTFLQHVGLSRDVIPQ